MQEQNEFIKKIVRSDSVAITPKHSIKTKIDFKIPGTDEVVYSTTNKIILPGAAFIARGLFDIPRNEITPSYNTALNLENTIYSAQPLSIEKTFLFCCGTDGCGRENSQVYAEDYGKWIAPEKLVPFRYVDKTKDLKAPLRAVYYGRKPITGKILYYFKGFEAEPEFYQQYIDGTPIDNTVYTNNNTTQIETVVKLSMKITKDDFRDYFIATTGINDARINSISLLTAWYKDIGTYRYYQDIRPLTRLNIPNESLIDLRKGIDIDYSLFF